MSPCELKTSSGSGPTPATEGKACDAPKDPYTITRGERTLNSSPRLYLGQCSRVAPRVIPVLIHPLFR
jgi:hypothetical protein